MNYIRLLFLFSLIFLSFYFDVSADFFGTDKAKEIIGTTDDLETAGNKIIGNFLNIIYFLITIFVFWGAFSIFTAGEDEEKVKKGKTIITHTILGFIIIFLVGAIVKFIFDSVTK